MKLIVLICLIFLYACADNVSEKYIVASDINNSYYNSWSIDGEEFTNRTLWDIEDNPVKFKNVIKDSSVLLYVSETMCGPCVIRQLDKIDTLVTIAGADNVVVLVRTSDKLSDWIHYNMIKDRGIKYYRCRQSVFLNLSLFMPTFCIVRHNMAIKSYVTGKLTESSDEVYLYNLNKYYKE